MNSGMWANTRNKFDPTARLAVTRKAALASAKPGSAAKADCRAGGVLPVGLNGIPVPVF
jgi:hypothetical protein